LRIYYLYNSGFALLYGDTALIIDYYLERPHGGRRGFIGGVVAEAELAAYKRVYVLSSHAHYDHFNPAVLGWQKAHPGVRYILSRDIEARVKAPDSTHGVAFLGKGERYGDGYIAVRAYGSTDEGVSFHVLIGGLSVFHAGDLNCWHWPEESTEEESRRAIAEFEREMAEIAQNVVEPDVAFFPVDPRMAADYDRGALYFARIVRPRLFVPMHFREETQAPAAFAEKLKDTGVRVWAVRERGESIEYEGGDST
jgi:L-ascorbate metabolism protein UlaG (beta-lactamase superfamily)